MRSVFAAAALALAIPAFAGEPAWHFKPGQTFTYECQSEFHYVAQANTAALAGPGTQGGRTTTTEDPQWETVTLKATVLAVGDDGAARIEFVVDGVKIETRFDSSGDHAEWDSSKDKTTDIVGYKRFEAIIGHKFQAIVGADGSIREMKNGAWPKMDTTGLKPAKKNEREERAATATHDPTPSEAWLNMIFCTAPEEKESWKRTLKLGGDENLSVKLDGKETVGKYACVRSKMESSDKNRAVKAEDLKVAPGGGVAEIAMALVNACEKKGMSWFSRQAGCLVKVELEGATEQSSGRDTIRTHFKWNVELKDRGTTELTPGSGTPEGGGVTETK